VKHSAGSGGGRPGRGASWSSGETGPDRVRRDSANRRGDRRAEADVRRTGRRGLGVGGCSSSARDQPVSLALPELLETGIRQQAAIALYRRLVLWTSLNGEVHRSPLGSALGKEITDPHAQIKRGLV